MCIKKCLYFLLFIWGVLVLLITLSSGYGQSYRSAKKIVIFPVINKSQTDMPLDESSIASSVAYALYSNLDASLELVPTRRVEELYREYLRRGLGDLSEDEIRYNFAKELGADFAIGISILYYSYDSFWDQGEVYTACTAVPQTCSAPNPNYKWSPLRNPLDVLLRRGERQYITYTGYNYSTVGEYTVYTGREIVEMEMDIVGYNINDVTTIYSRNSTIGDSLIYKRAESNINPYYLYKCPAQGDYWQCSSASPEALDEYKNGDFRRSSERFRGPRTLLRSCLASSLSDISYQFIGAIKRGY